jgi:hypothetical protein
MRKRKNRNDEKKKKKCNVKKKKEKGRVTSNRSFVPNSFVHCSPFPFSNAFFDFDILQMRNWDFFTQTCFK